MKCFLFFFVFFELACFGCTVCACCVACLWSECVFVAQFFFSFLCVFSKLPGVTCTRTALSAPRNTTGRANNARGACRLVHSQHYNFCPTNNTTPKKKKKKPRHHLKHRPTYIIDIVYNIPTFHTPRQMRYPEFNTKHLPSWRKAVRQ